MISELVDHALFLVFAAALAVSVTACGDDDTSPPPPNVSPSTVFMPDDPLTHYGIRTFCEGPNRVYVYNGALAVRADDPRCVG